MELATATWAEGRRTRVALVARLASGRLADLERVEAIRLRKLGEGDADRLAAALVPPSLPRVLAGGPGALARARQTLAYAEKWDRRGTLPGELAPWPEQVALAPLLEGPTLVHFPDGSLGEGLALQGPGARLEWAPGLDLQAALAVVGMKGRRPAGRALALVAGGTVVAGAWLQVDLVLEGALVLHGQAGRRTADLARWADLGPPQLRPGEVALLAPLHLDLLPAQPGDQVQVQAPFGSLAVSLGRDGAHPTLQ